jgi:hypothetical protein
MRGREGSRNVFHSSGSSWLRFSKTHLQSQLGSYFQLAQSPNPGLPEPALGSFFKPLEPLNFGFVAQNGSAL